MSAMKVGKTPAKINCDLPFLWTLPSDLQLRAEKPSHLLPVLLAKEGSVAVVGRHPPVGSGHAKE